MKPTLVSVIAAALLVAIVGPAPAQGQATTEGKEKGASAPTGRGVEDQIKRLEQDRAEAVVRSDTEALEKHTSADYTFITRKGQLRSRAQTMNGIKSGETKITSYKLSALTVRAYGNTAIVTGQADIKGTMEGKDASGAVLFTRVYVKQIGRWLAVAFQQTPIINP